MGRMKEPLLNKTLKIYLIFFSAILIILAPIFYFIAEKLFIHDVDKNLLSKKKDFIHYVLPKISEEDVPIINKANKNIKIIKDTNQTKKTKITNVKIYDSLHNRKVVHRVIHAPINIDGKAYLYHEQINIERKTLIKNIVVIFLLAIIILLVGLLLITKYYSKILWDPFYKMLSTIEKQNIENLNEIPKFPDCDIEEFIRLKRSLENLIGKDLTVYKNQKEFIQNAAHELQTPIAILQAQIETLINYDKNIDLKKAEILSSIKETISRLNRLNKNLLLLSKIEYLCKNNLESFNLVELIIRINELHGLCFKEKQIEFITDIYVKELIFNANISLIETLFNNLYSNAYKYTNPKGIVKVKLYKTFFQISNTAHEGSLPESKIFERFYKTNPSSSGSGIGLSIVKKIVEAYNWKIFYKYYKNSHFFTIIFR